MVDYFKKYSWILIAMACILGGTIYTLVTGGPGFNIGTDSEKIGIVSNGDAQFIWYKDIESVEMIDVPELGESVNAVSGHNTIYGTFKDEKYGEYTAYIFTKQTQCVEVVHKDGVLLINDSNKKKTNEIFNKLTAAVNK